MNNIKNVVHIKQKDRKNITVIPYYLILNSSFKEKNVNDMIFGKMTKICL